MKKIHQSIGNNAPMMYDRTLQTYNSKTEINNNNLHTILTLRIKFIMDLNNLIYNP